MLEYPRTPPQSFIVIGYGNQLRGDDAIGQLVADTVAEWNFYHVKTKAVHQLMPELAEDLATVDAAIFVDACVATDEESLLKLESISPADSCRIIMGHTSNPRSLLALTRALYDYSPHSWLISVPGINFELSDHLSPFAERGVAAAITQIEDMIKYPSLFYTRE
jgi:hydrogenase maturation protease